MSWWSQFLTDSVSVSGTVAQLVRAQNNTRYSCHSCSRNREENNELILILPSLLTFSWCLPVTQVLSTRIVAMKASLCKLSSSTIARVCDYHAKLFLIAISCTLKSLLRPHFLNTPDKSPGDRLTEICSKITDIGR